MMTQILSSIEFALENGFTSIERLEEKDGCIAFVGTFGYISVNKEDAKQIESVIAQYTSVEKSEAELLLEWEKENGFITIQKEVETASVVEGLTEKENNTLHAIVESSYEYGLPVSVDEIKELTGYSKRSIVGIVSSLYKKNILEAYEIEENSNEFHLTQEMFDKLVLGE